MRKVTVEMTPDKELEKMIGPLMAHVKEMELVELLRLDLRHGVKIGVVKLTLAPGSTIQDIISTNLFEITVVEVIEQKGDEVTCLMKVKAPTGFEELREKADLDLTWAPPMKLSRDKILYSFIGEDDQIRKMVDMMSGFGKAVKVSLHRTSFSDGDRLSVLTPRQKEIVIAAKRMGYYRYPRKVGAEEVAKALGVSTSTAVEHLRKAETRIIDSLLAGY